ncbi:hypothetical protein C8R44DRAFT_896335 [Mycena epipterygia]|nr:hypothetical protein C8R44DRAFT_896335 [Mycena epipterygia]
MPWNPPNLVLGLWQEESTFTSPGFVPQTHAPDGSGYDALEVPFSSFPLRSTSPVTATSTNHARFQFARPIDDSIILKVQRRRTQRHTRRRELGLASMTSRSTIESSKKATISLRHSYRNDDVVFRRACWMYQFLVLPSIPECIIAVDINS